MSDTVSGGQSAHMMGSQIVSERMAAELDVRLSAPARRVTQTDDGVTVHADGGAWRARQVVCALSPALVSQIAFDPPLPAERRLLHQRFPNGRNTKAVDRLRPSLLERAGPERQCHRDRRVADGLLRSRRRRVSNAVS